MNTTTPTECHGCENPGAAIRTYIVIYRASAGTSADTVRYCDTCADLGAIDWNGETAAIVPADALFLADDNPDQFTPTDVLDIGNRRLALDLFALPVGGRSDGVERVQ